MIYLTATTDKLQLVTSAAATVDVVALYVEAVTSGLTGQNPGRQLTAITTATTTDILGAPGASNTRTLKQVTVRNKDATNQVDVTLLYNANGTTYELYKVTLLPGEAFIYIEGVGFFPLKPAPVLDKVLVANADVVNASAAWVDITGLTVPLLNGKRYVVQAGLFHISNATTTGAQFGYNIGAAPTLAQFGNYSGVTNSATAGVMSLGTATARDTAITVQTTGSANITLTLIAGMIQPSADGTFALRCFSEIAVAAGLTVKAGSYLIVRQER